MLCSHNRHIRFKLTADVAFLHQRLLSFGIIVLTCVVGFGGQILSRPNLLPHEQSDHGFDRANRCKLTPLNPDPTRSGCPMGGCC